LAGPFVGELFFKPFEPFVFHPERIALLAALFVVAYGLLRWRGQVRAWPMLVAAGAWASWAPWEAHAKAMDYNIRVDLLVICPLLAALTGLALVAAIWSRPRRPADSPSEP
jgi:hypothetical protein